MFKDFTQIVMLGAFLGGFLLAFFAIIAGPIFLLAWALDTLYSRIWETPDSTAPQITYWWWVLSTCLTRWMFPMPTLTWKVNEK